MIQVVSSRNLRRFVPKMPIASTQFFPFYPNCLNLSNITQIFTYNTYVTSMPGTHCYGKKRSFPVKNADKNGDTLIPPHIAS
jgi:hypothetical protein